MPTQPISKLLGLRLIANNSPGAYSVVLEASGTQYGGLNDGDVLGHRDQIWNTAEFNVFGAGNPGMANLTPNPGTTIVVRTNVDNGTTNPPQCSQAGFTNEQNNLTRCR